MKKVILNMDELKKYQVIKKLVETNGNKHRAAITLSCTVRNINLLIKKYLKYGKAGFIHGNRNRKPANTLDNNLIEKIIELKDNKYHDFNWYHFLEKLNEVENINISYFALYNILSNAGYISYKAQKKTKRKKRLELENKSRLSKVDKQLLLMI